MTVDRATPKWLEWAREIQAITQYGLQYATNDFERDRYIRLRSIAAEIVAAHSELDETTVTSLYEEQFGDATPKVDVRGVVFDRNRVLLVRERSDGGRWTLPGGWANVGESPSEAVAREVLEESGYKVRVKRLIAVYDRDRHDHPPGLFHIYKLFFDCELVGGGPSDGPETYDPSFFSEGEIPELSAGRVTETQLKRFFQLNAKPDLVTDYD